MNLELVHEDSEILHKKLKEFDFNGEMDAKELADSLYYTMCRNEGMGLSANQVGIDARVFVIGIAEYRLDVFNPRIINYTGADTMLDEGCLSFPLVYMRMKRPGAIHVKFQDVNGKEQEQIFSGITARVFLHEYDHLEGITFKDKVSKMKWDMAVKRRFKSVKKQLTKELSKTLIKKLA